MQETRDRNEALTRLQAYRGRLPADFKFDRDAANERDHTPVLPEVAD